MRDRTAGTQPTYSPGILRDPRPKAKVSGTRGTKRGTELLPFGSNDGRPFDRRRAYRSTRRVPLRIRQAQAADQDSLVHGIPPTNNFSTLVSQVQTYGEPTSVNTTSNDVTSQYVNLQAQIDALNVSLRQYLKIMQQTDSISAILSVQAQVTNIETQIEQLQGQLNVLDNETTYGTLTVDLTGRAKLTTAAKPRKPAPKSGVLQAWDDGVGGFVSGFEWIIRVAGPLLLALIAIAGAVLIGRLSWRRVRRMMI